MSDNVVDIHSRMIVRQARRLPPGFSREEMDRKRLAGLQANAEIAPVISRPLSEDEINMIARLRQAAKAVAETRGLPFTQRLLDLLKADL